MKHRHVFQKLTTDSVLIILGVVTVVIYETTCLKFMLKCLGMKYHQICNLFASDSRENVLKTCMCIAGSTLTPAKFLTMQLTYQKIN